MLIRRKRQMSAVCCILKTREMVMLKAVEPNINIVVREVLIPAGLECLAEASI